MEIKKVMLVTQRWEIDGSDSDLKDEECSVFWFTSEGRAIFKGQLLGVIISKKEEILRFEASSDGYVTKLHFPQGGQIKYKRSGCYLMLESIHLSDAVATGDIDQNSSEAFTWEICAPYNSMAYIDRNGKISFSRSNQKNDYLDTSVNLPGFKVLRWVEPLLDNDTYVKFGQPVAQAMPQEHSKRFAKALKRIAEEERLKNEIELISNQIKNAKTELKSLDEAQKKSKSSAETLKKIVEQEEAKRSEVIAEAKATAAEIIRDATDKGEAAASETIESLVAEARERKKISDTEAAQSLEAAKRKAQEIMDASEVEADALRSAVNEEVENLSLEALVKRMMDLTERGEVLPAADRVILRQLYRTAGEILTRSQGHEMPADPTLDRSLDTLDQIETLYDTLATKIKGIEAKDWPDQVKEMAIQSLMAKVDVKAGALTNEDLEED